MEKKQLLFICHRIPYPPNKGDKIRSYNFIKFLSSFCSIHLAFLVDDRNDLKYVEELYQFADNIFYEEISPLRKKLVSFFRALLLNSTISVQYFYSSRLQSKIDIFLEKNRIDRVFCFSSPSAEYVFNSIVFNRDLLSSTPAIMDLIDVDSHKWRQYAEGCNYFLKWLYRREADLLLDYEKKIVKSFLKTILVSEPEKNILREYIQTNSLCSVSNGVDIDYFSPQQGEYTRKQKPILVFVGAMDYLPNIEGVLWFVKDILPEIQKLVPDVQFQIVGSKPSREIVELRSMQGVTVTGFVEDVRDYLRSADIVVVPLKIARGIQNKVLEAMAMGKPVVCTEDALVGIDAHPGNDVMVASDKEIFTATVIQLLDNDKKRKGLGRKARECMVEKYSWQSRLEQLRLLMSDG